MSNAQWELTVTPTAPELYEAMTLAGRGMLSRGQMGMLLLQSVFVGICAPIGATIIAWAGLMVVGGRELASLPVWALPMSFATFAILSLWLTRQAYFVVAQNSVRTRFGRSQQVTLDYEGITIVTPNSRWHSGWADVELLRGGKTVISVCISSVAIALPRSAFLGPRDADEALLTMHSWWEGAR